LSEVLVAGIGNVFRRDDGFGVEVVRRLALAGAQAGVRVVDFGIRGFDLALALSAGVEAAIIVDASARGGTPGTLYVLEPGEVRERGTFDPHGVDPLRAFELARSLGGTPRLLRIVACEPGQLGSEDEPETGLSPAVEAAMDRALVLVRDVSRELLATLGRAGGHRA
jgi:hydrogenase maturation protease